MGSARIGVFGGTFDPVHCGHLRALFELTEALSLDEVRVVPCGVPAHRAAPHAPASARLAMLDAALTDLPRCRVDRRELERAGPSYTVDTLASMRNEWPDAALWLLVGHDAFCTLPQWHRWRTLFKLANVGVARRPGTRLEVGGALAAEIARRAATDLGAALSGCIAQFETSQLEISSSHLRRLAAAGRSLRWLVPDPVGVMIERNRWYATQEN